MRARIFFTPAYLIKHRYVFYFRVAVPLDLRPLVGKTEIRLSLRTAFLTEAKAKVKRLASVVDDLFALLRTRLKDMASITSKDIKEYVEGYVRAALELYEQERLLRPESWTRHDIEKKMASFSMSREVWLDILNLGKYMEVAGTAREFFLSKGITNINPDSLEFRQVCAEIIRGQIKSIEIEMRRTIGDYRDEYASMPSLIEPQPPPLSLNVGAVTANHTLHPFPSVMLSEAIESFIQEKKRLKSWDERSSRDLATKLRLFQEVQGDVPITALAKEHARRFKEVVEKMPTRRSVRAPYRGKSLAELMATKIPDEDKLTPATIGQYFLVVGSFLKWLRKQYDGVQEGLSDVLQIPPLPPAREQRQAFTKEDLDRIFLSPPYVEDKMGSPFKFWLPILGLFTGLRIEELCQLHPDDLMRVEDIWCLDINEAEGKKVKTESSRRLVPLHPFLTDELNFPGFVAHAAKARQTRIFHQLKKQSTRWSHYPSRWFSEFLKKVGLKKPGRKLAFHSFRHTFVRAGKLANVEREKIMEVVGHGSPSKDITFGRYGKQYPPSILFTDVILKLDFGVDLSHLKKSIFVAKRP